jgi:hypothetical protein
MPIEIRALTEADIQAVVHLSLRAWAPVFASFETVLGEEIYGGSTRTGRPPRPGP